MSSVDKCLLNVVKSFVGQYEDELTIEPGHIGQLIKKIDKYWYEVFLEDQIGKIPIDCCREMQCVSLNQLRICKKLNQAIFIAKHDFINNCQEGDLKFSRFEIIIGFHPINDDWWNGTRLNSVQTQSNELIVHNSNCGIFPLTYVWKLREDLLPDYIFDSNGVKLLNFKEQSPADISIKNDNDLSKNITKEEPSTSSYLFYVKVTTTMKAQLDEEIDLPELDEILGVISMHDKLYYLGESLSRKVKGIFPKNFVTKLDNHDINDQSTKSPICDNQELETSSSGPSPLPPSFSPPALPLIDNNFSDKFQYLYSNEVQINNEQLDDLPPSYESTMLDHPVVYGYVNDMFNEMEPYGRVLYDFEAQDQSELSLHKNQIVRLIRYYDQDWMEGEINGQIGFFPRSYISIIVDCKQTNEQQDSSKYDKFSVEQNQVTAIDFPKDTYAQVLYDFEGEMEQDLKIKAGDVITLLRRFTSTDWIEAQDSNGNIGFVHLNFCQPMQQNSMNNESCKIESNSESCYPKLCDDVAEKISEYSNLDEKAKIKPQRRAPLAPRGNVFPTFNQFLIQEKQEHYQFEIDGNESATNLTSTKTNPKNQKQSQRECVITELITTERDYCYALSICHQVFNSSTYEAEKVNVNTEKLVGNMKNIINVSKHLIKLLENYAHNRSFIDQRVGICFLDLKFEINESYTQYCRNHDTVHSLLKYYENNSTSTSYIKACLGRIQDQTNCFDLSSIWIKPVQRILKYPLLLNELIKFTEEDHVDYEPLKMAIQMITNIATCINEHKRRQDLIKKYCKTKDPTLTEKLKNLNMHSVMKKGSRLRYRILSTLTFSSGAKDKVYDSTLSTFQEIEKIIRSFIKDVKEYMGAMEKYHVQLLVVLETISDYCDLKRNSRFDFDQIRNKYGLMYDHFKKFKTAIDSDVLKLLAKLLNKFNGPLKLISKREDKRIDYEASLKSKNDSNLYKNTFEALNQQLIDELPRLSDLSLSILYNCIETFLYESRNYIAIIGKCQLDLHELSLVNNIFFEFFSDIEEIFRVKSNLNMEKMIHEFSLLHASSFQDSSTSTFARLTRNRGSNTWRNSVPINVVHQQDVEPSKSITDADKQVQLESHRNQIIIRYSEKDLYLVKNNYRPNDVLEISVNNGDLVGVIKYKEPNGHENRWFVDRGFIKGFIPRNILTPYHKEPIFETTGEIVHRYDEVPLEPDRYYSLPTQIDENEANSKKSIIEELVEFDPLLAKKNDNEQNEYYTAAYPFKASSDHQLSMNFGQRVLVLCKHDASNNPEWWLVSHSDKKGFVPRDYLKK